MDIEKLIQGIRKGAVSIGKAVQEKKNEKKSTTPSQEEVVDV